MDCFHCLGKKIFPPSCKGLMHMDLITGECLVCAGTGEMPPSVEMPTEPSLINDIEKEVNGLCDYVTELEKDKERLDFIEKCCLGGRGWEAKVSHTRGFVISNTNRVDGTRTLRGAIDAAIKEYKTNISPPT